MADNKITEKRWERNKLRYHNDTAYRNSVLTTQRKYHKTEKGKNTQRKATEKFLKTEKGQRYIIEHKEYVKKYGVAYRKENKEHIQELTKQWRKRKKIQGVLSKITEQQRYCLSVYILTVYSVIISQRNLSV